MSLCKPHNTYFFYVERINVNDFNKRTSFRSSDVISLFLFIKIVSTSNKSNAGITIYLEFEHQTVTTLLHLHSCNTLNILEFITNMRSIILERT